MPFGLGRPVRSTLTLLILVPHAPLPLEPAPHPIYTSRAPTRPRSHSPHPKDRGHAEGGRIRCGCDPLQVDSHSARERLANNHGAENYGRRCPEGMLGVASALPDTRALTAERR